MIPYLWRVEGTSDEAVPDREIAGGLMLGASTGALALHLVALGAQRDRTDVGETALYDLFGSASAAAPAP